VLFVLLVYALCIVKCGCMCFGLCFSCMSEEAAMALVGVCSLYCWYMLFVLLSVGVCVLVCVSVA